MRRWIKGRGVCRCGRWPCVARPGTETRRGDSRTQQALVSVIAPSRLGNQVDYEKRWRAKYSNDLQCAGQAGKKTHCAASRAINLPQARGTRQAYAAACRQKCARETNSGPGRSFFLRGSRSEKKLEWSQHNLVSIMILSPSSSLRHLGEISIDH